MAAEDRLRLMALYVLWVGMLMILLDATTVNVALPTIQDDLVFAPNDLALVNANLPSRSSRRCDRRAEAGRRTQSDGARAWA